MKKIFTVSVFVAAFLLVVSSCMAYNIKIKVNNVSYSGRPLGGTMEYTSNGKVVGYAKQQGGQTIYTDKSNNQIGSVTKLGDRYIFKDGKGVEIGSISVLGDKHIYKNGNNSDNGSATVLGGKTIYKAANNADIGEADTTEMPFRPIPIEKFLSKNGSGEMSYILPRVNVVKSGSIAEKGNIKVKDIIVGYVGLPLTCFDSVKSSDCNVVKDSAADNFINPSKGFESYFILARFNGKEYEIVLSDKMPATARGYSWGTLVYTEQAYKQVKKIYEEWAKKQ